jgi:hypothetical protein
MSYESNIKELLETKVIVTMDEGIDTTLLKRFRREIRDEDYFNFIAETQNGGLFLDRSLQFYGFASTKNYQDIDFINQIFSEEFGNYFKGILTIGQDIFANQFVYDLSTQEIFLFNIETADKEKLANNFKHFIEILFSDLEYYSGRTFILNWNNSFGSDQRLCPQKPFIIGGDYVNENFYASSFPKYLYFFADIAKQIHEIPDGTPIKLKIINPPLS